MPALKLKLRYDYKCHAKARKLFSSKSIEEMAEETRQHKVLMMRNVPIQGISIQEIDMSQEVYAVIDDITGRRIAYAPVIITMCADSLEDAIKYVAKEEFRTVDIIEPSELVLSQTDIEKLLIKFNYELLDYRDLLLRKIDNAK